MPALFLFILHPLPWFSVYSNLMIQLPVSSLSHLMPKAFLLPSLLRIPLYSQLSCHQPLGVNQPTGIFNFYPQHLCHFYGQVPCQAYPDFINTSQREISILDGSSQVLRWFSQTNTGITKVNGIRRMTINQGQMSIPHPDIVRHTLLALKWYPWYSIHPTHQSPPQGILLAHSS